MTAGDPESAPPSRRLRRVSSNRVGPSAKTSVSITAGAVAMLTICALRGGIGRARPRRHLSPCQRGRSIVATGDPRNSDRIHGCRRPGRRRYVSRGRAAMPPVFSCGNTASPEKWLELLKEITPHVTRVAVLRESAIAAGPGQFGVIQAAAPSLGVELRPVDVRDAGEIERALTAFAQGSKGGLIVT